MSTSGVAVVAPPRYRGVRDVVLVMALLPAAVRARRAAQRTLPAAVAAMTGRRSVSLGVAPERVARAAARASRLAARMLGGLDSCLTRSLVTGAALASRGRVELHVGFRPSTDERTVDGHAWVTLEGRVVGERQLPDKVYERTVVIAFDEGGAW